MTDMSTAGSGEIRDWLARASTEFTYTRTLLGADAIDANTWLVTNHLEGDFPGGVVDLRYRFVLADGLIAEVGSHPDASTFHCQVGRASRQLMCWISRSMRQPSAVRTSGSCTSRAATGTPPPASSST